MSSKFFKPLQILTLKKNFYLLFKFDCEPKICKQILSKYCSLHKILTLVARIWDQLVKEAMVGQHND